MRAAAVVVVGIALALAAASWSAAATAPAAAPSATAAAIARGRFLVTIGTCNDCHTPGWRESDGTVPVANWLTGTTVGFRGSWGTSYPANVRLVFQTTPVAQWINAVRTRAGHPPMVWQDLRVLSDADLGAIYAFVRSLGPAGVPAPDALPPWRVPTTPVIDYRIAVPTPGPSP